MQTRIDRLKVSAQAQCVAWSWLLAYVLYNLIRLAI